MYIHMCIRTYIYIYIYIYRDIYTYIQTTAAFDIDDVEIETESLQRGRGCVLRR